MPDGTEDQIREKLNALCRELSREIIYIESNIHDGATVTFTTTDGKTITVKNGVIQ